MIKFVRIIRMLLIMLCLTLASTNQAFSAPKVVVSIAPLHSIVTAVMKGIGEPKLLIPPGQSPHVQGLSPSSTKALHQANLVLWIGEDYEVAMAKTMTQLDITTVQIPFLKLPDINLHRLRLDEHGENDHGQDTAEEHTHHKHEGESDPHVWLSLGNVRVLVVHLRDQLMAMDNGNKQYYSKNADDFLIKLDALDMAIKIQMQGIEQIPYMVFHDAYQYFEMEQGLHTSTAVTLNPQQMPGAKRISELRKEIQEKNIKCLFSEPQFESKLVSVLVEDSNTKTSQLDPLGSHIEPGAGLWFELLDNLAKSFRNCLGS